MNAPTQRAESTAVATVDAYAGSQLPSNLMLNPQLMNQMMAVAESMSNATVTVPVHFRGKPGDCLAVVMQATQWNMNPYAVAQKTHVVNGTLGYEAQLVHAVLQTTGAIEGTFTYEYRGEGPGIECRVGAVCRGERSLTWGEWLSASSVTTKNSPLWKTNPKQQIGYLQVKNWARAFKPGAILGVYTTDELQASEPTEKHMGPADVVPPQKPATYPEDKFKTNLPAWQEVIRSGCKTADQIIAMAETKHPLTDAQKDEIRKAKADTPAAAPAADKAQDVTPKTTYAVVADRINSAKDHDELDAAKDLIGEVTDPQHRAELVALSELRGDKLAF